MKIRLAGGLVAFAVILSANTHMASAQSSVSSPNGASVSSKDKDLGTKASNGSSAGGWNRNIASSQSSQSHAANGDVLDLTIDPNPSERKKRVVILMTDGEPTQNSSANGDVLDLTIDPNPSERKRRGASVVFSTFE